MVKQVGVQSVQSIKGQSYAVEPVSLDIDRRGFHETKAEILEKLSGGKSKSYSKLDLIKKYGVKLDRPTQEIEAMRERRKVVPFTGGIHSPFLNFSSGRASKVANRERAEDPYLMRPVIATNTGFNRY